MLTAVFYIVLIFYFSSLFYAKAVGLNSVVYKHLSRNCGVSSINF